MSNAQIPPPSVIIPPITWGMFGTLIGTIATGFVAVIWVLVSLVYGGLKDEIKETKDSVKELSASYRDAVTSGIKVQDLITKAPMLDKQISEMAMDIKGMKDNVVLTTGVIKRLDDMKVQLDSMQYQIHHPEKNR